MDISNPPLEVLFGLVALFGLWLTVRGFSIAGGSTPRPRRAGRPLDSLAGEAIIERLASGEDFEYLRRKARAPAELLRRFSADRRRLILSFLDELDDRIAALTREGWRAARNAHNPELAWLVVERTARFKILLVGLRLQLAIGMSPVRAGLSLRRLRRAGDALRAAVAPSAA